MSVHAISWVLRDCDEDVAGRRLVLLVLADKADHDGSKAYPSIETIAREARMSERGVRYALRALEESGRIERLGIHPQTGTYEYRLVIGVNTVQGGAESAPRGGQNATENVSQIAPYPSFNRPSKKPLSDKSDERLVFTTWIESTGRTGATRFSDKRRKVVRRALDNYELADVIDAVQGWRKSAHHRGENERRTVYNDLELLLRDAQNIERFRDLNRENASGRLNGTPTIAQIQEAQRRRAAA